MLTPPTLINTRIPIHARAHLSHIRTAPRVFALPWAPVTLRCSKTFGPVPIAHRQHRHSGRCRWVHGHGWTFRVTFGASAPDAHGFVVDFGGLRSFADWIDENLDHGILLSRDDGPGRAMVDAAPDLFKVCWVEVASCEGLAQKLMEVFSALLGEAEGDRAWIEEIEVWEDDANRVSLTAPR